MGKQPFRRLFWIKSEPMDNHSLNKEQNSVEELETS